MADVWQLIKTGDYLRACELADVEAAREPSSLLPLRNKVVALLQLRRYEEAERLGGRIIEVRGGETESDFVFVGIALWFQYRHREAIVVWKEARENKYTDAAGGVRIPLLLFYGSLQQNDDELRAGSLQMLKKRAAVKAWPGPLAGFITGHFSETELLARVTREKILRERHLCQAAFSIGLSRKSQGDLGGAIESMESACSQGPVSLLEAEYFLARWECEQAGRTPQ
jgi:hypothetical protein